VHPLLFLSHEKLKKQVVPLTMTLTEKQRILVISGPNAGGKSVCLKTVGLLQYMFQSGILPPVKEDSEFGIFQRIFIDIGDEQSLENDLSTYTSKLNNIKFFIEHLNDQSLFLIDEFGTGTDPSLGGAIAEASLETINLKKAYGVVTTHYSNLKLLAGRVPGIINGAMLFDTARLRPLYQLRTGKPGSSFAFEIARQIGFPEDVLKKASAITGKSQLDFDRELQDLEVEKDKLIKKSTEVYVADEFLNELIQKYKTLTENLEKSKKEIIQKAKDDALKILNTSNSIIEKTIKEIRESQAEKEKTKSARTNLIKLKEKLVEEPPAPTPQRSGKEEVFHSLSSIKLPGDNGQKPSTDRPRGPYQSFYDDLHKKLQTFQMTLDLRGKRADEAHSLIQRYIDDALLLSIPEVRILHGKGNGVLRQITRDYLATVKEVKKYHDERIEAGGAGITVVYFK
jgi:DNA mismatch repair protein MutS2